MKQNVLILALAALALASCGGEAPASSSSPVASSESSSPALSSSKEESSSQAESSSSASSSEISSSESASSSEAASSESQSSSQEASSEQSSEESSPAESSSVSESSSDSSAAPASSNWTLTRADIPETQQSQYNRDFDFTVQSETGSVTLHGDYLQQGTGSNAEFIQMRKRTNSKTYEEERIYFYVKEGSYTSVEFEIQHKVIYTGDDISGVPAIYSAEKIDESNGEQVEVEMTLSQDEKTYHCTATLPYGQFRFENASPDYALYMTYFTAIA